MHKQQVSSHSSKVVITKEFDITITKTTLNNNPSLMLIMTDTSERKKILELRNINEYKDNVLASVSHDLKTPLNSILV